MFRSIYYLTGMGGRLDSGLGQALLSRGSEIAGRELVGEFRKLDFQDQIDHIADDLKSNHWSEEAHVIANSFGAYQHNISFAIKNLRFFTISTFFKSDPFFLTFIF